MSMLSLVDIGSGLWPYAHNTTNATYGGYWNGISPSPPPHSIVILHVVVRPLGLSPFLVRTRSTRSLTFAHIHTHVHSDLDMMEIGNSPDFVCGQDEPSLLACQAHYTMWTIMKGVLTSPFSFPSLFNPLLHVVCQLFRFYCNASNFPYTPLSLTHTHTHNHKHTPDT